MSLRDLVVAKFHSRRGSGGTPGPCKTLEVVKCTPTSIKLTWAEPERCEPAVDRYHVQYTPKYLGVWLDANSESIDAKPGLTEPRCVIDHLDPANRYMLRVRAGNSLGWGPFNVFPGEVWTRTVDGMLSAPLPQFERITLRKSPSSDGLKVHIPEGGGLGARTSSNGSVGSAPHAKPPSHPPGHGKFRPHSHSGGDAGFSSTPIPNSALTSPNSSCNLCGTSLLCPGKCRSKNSRTRERCGCTMYQQHLVPEYRPLCGRCEHQLGSHQAIVSFTCAKCSNIVCQGCRRVVHESMESEHVAVTGFDGLLSPISACGSTGSGKSCYNPRHVHLNHDAFMALKTTVMDRRPFHVSSSNPQLDAFVSAGRSGSVGSLDSDVTVAGLSVAPAVPGDDTGDPLDQPFSRHFESTATEDALDPSYVTLGCPLNPEIVRYLWETLRRSEGAMFSELAQTAESDAGEPSFLNHEQLVKMPVFAASSIPFAIVSQDALVVAPPPLAPPTMTDDDIVCEPSGRSRSDFSDVMAAELARSGFSSSPILSRRPLSVGLGVSVEENDTASLPPPPSPCVPMESVGDSASESSPQRPAYDFLTLCSSCARDLGTRSGFTSENVSELASPTVEAGIRRASSLHGTSELKRLLSFSTLLPAPPAFRVRSVSDSNFTIRSPPALVSPLLSRHDMSPTSSASSSGLPSDAGRPRSVDRVSSLLRAFQFGESQSPEDQDGESLLDDHCDLLPPRLPLRSSTSVETFTPRALHSQMDPASVANVIKVQLRSATTLLGYLSVLRKHRQLIHNYPLHPPPESEIVGLLRPINVGTSDTDSEYTDAPPTTWIPSLCQVTLDLIRESGVFISVDPELLDSHDDAVKIEAFGELVESFSDSQTGILRYLALASGSAVVAFERMLGLVLSSLAVRQLKLLGDHHDDGAAIERQVDEFVRAAIPAVLARTSRTIASGDAWRITHSVFTHHDNPNVRMTLTHTQPHEWQEMGITSETMKIHPLQVAVHQIDGMPLVTIMHTDVYRMRDVNAPETQAWAVVKVTVVHTVAISAQAGSECAHVPFRLPQSVTGDVDSEAGRTPDSTTIVSEGMQTPPLVLRHAVTDVRRYLDVDCLGKRAGEVTVKILSVVGLRASAALKSVHAIVRLGRREVKGNNIAVSSVHSVDAWKESFAFVWDGVDILSLSLWGHTAGVVHEECVGHVQASLFQLVSGVPCRLRYDLNAADADSCRDPDVSYGEIELEVYYSHIRTVPLKKRPSRRRASAMP